MSKLWAKAEQIVNLWSEEYSKEERTEILYQALRLNAEDILDWATRYVKPYTTDWDEGQKAREYMQHVLDFKEKL